VPVPGYGNNTVNILRLWAAHGTDLFDLEYFNSGDYIRSIDRAMYSENITRVLYPNDKVAVGQELRLRQEYFLASASLQDILRRYRRTQKNFDALPDKVAVQINDTHPAVAVAELMRLLVDIEGLEWDKAWEITQGCFGYTNHTLMPEALEKWSVELFGRVLRGTSRSSTKSTTASSSRSSRSTRATSTACGRMSIIEEGREKWVRMAHLAVVGSHAVNGVSALHGRCSGSGSFRSSTRCSPAASPRRPTASRRGAGSSPATRALGADRRAHRHRVAREPGPAPPPHAPGGGPAFRAQWRAVKRKNKERLATLIEHMTDVRVSPDALMDVHVKRIHEYKRQLLNVLRVIDLYRRMKEPGGDAIPPRTVVFGGKAAPATRWRS
jgi:starch phosphorylase